MMEFSYPSATAVAVLLDRATYSEAVIYKCFYWYGGDYQVTIEAETTRTRVQLTVPEGKPLPPSFPQALLSRIQNDLVDFKLRELVMQETQIVRELLVAKAFAHYDSEQPLRTELADPVGFHYSDGTQA